MTKKKIKEPDEPTYAASWHCFGCGKDLPIDKPMTRAIAVALRSSEEEPAWCYRCKQAVLWLMVDYPPEAVRRIA